jgi:hypothetical protein
MLVSKQLSTNVCNKISWSSIASYVSSFSIRSNEWKNWMNRSPVRRSPETLALHDLFCPLHFYLLFGMYTLLRSAHCLLFCSLYIWLVLHLVEVGSLPALLHLVGACNNKTAS